MKGRRPKEADDAAAFPQGRPDCPDWLSPRAAELFAEHVAYLDEIGAVAKVDQAILAAFCQTYAAYQTSQELLAGEGQIIGGKLNPAARLADMYLKQLRQYAVELGFTPGSRNRFKFAPKPPVGADDLENP